MSLCVDCGLCCDGTLFDSAPVSADEAASLEGRVTLTPARDRLAQPCRALVGCRCAVYAERPRVCRAFECAVLGALERGEVSEERAKEELERVFALRRAVARALGADDERAALKAARSREANGDLPEAARPALAALDRLALVLQLTPRRP